MDDYGNQLPSEAIARRFDKGIKRMEAIEAEARAVRQELQELCLLREEVGEADEYEVG